ncbi:unnamed protein product, partial [Timema podura]|nr:unnamed protein product [Timema podura]
GEEYLFREDWGEQLVGKHRPVVVMCDTKLETLSVLEGIPDHFSSGQVVWTPDGNGVVGVAWLHEPRRLGLIYCTNRVGYIFHLTLGGVFTLLSGDDQAVRSPRFSPDGEYLVWLERPAGGGHHAAHRLMAYKWPPSPQVRNRMELFNGPLTRPYAPQGSVLTGSTWCGWRDQPEGDTTRLTGSWPISGPPHLR